MIFFIYKLVFSVVKILRRFEFRSFLKELYFIIMEFISKLLNPPYTFINKDESIRLST